MTRNFDLQTALLNRYKLKKSELLMVISELEDRFRFNRISVDMSTGENDAGNRIFAKFVEKQGDTLLCEFDSANYDYDCEKIRIENFDLRQIRDELDCKVANLQEQICELNKYKKALKKAFKVIREITDAVDKYFNKERTKNFADDVICGVGLEAGQFIQDIKGLKV